MKRLYVQFHEVNRKIIERHFEQVLIPVHQIEKFYVLFEKNITIGSIV